MFSDSDDDDVIPLSQRLGDVPPRSWKPDSSARQPPPEIVDIVESSSSPIPVLSSQITIPDSPDQKSGPPSVIEVPSSPASLPSSSSTPCASKKKKPNTPKVAPGSSKKLKKKAIRNIDKLEDVKPESKRVVGVGGVLPLSQEIGRRPLPKISCRDCEAKIDHSLIELHFTDEELRKAFSEFEVRHKYNTKSIKRKTVTWVREVKVQSEDPENANMPFVRTEFKEENSVLVILDAVDFAQMVLDFKLTRSLEEVEVLSTSSSESSIESIDPTDDESPLKRTGSPSLISFCKKMCMTFPGKDLTVLIVGMNAYFQKLKSKESKKYRDIIHGKDPSKSKRKSSMKHPFITKEDVLEILIDVDLNAKEISKSGQQVGVLFADKSDEIVTMIASVTKTVAEAPFKATKKKSKCLAWFADGDKSVAVDVKSKEDVPRVWTKQLEQFPKVSQLVAAEIISIYKTPLDLLDVYSNIFDRQEAEELLQDIAVGSKGSRRVGPEISKKICTFMNASDGSYF